MGTVGSREFFFFSQLAFWGVCEGAFEWYAFPHHLACIILARGDELAC